MGLLQAHHKGAVGLGQYEQLLVTGPEPPTIPL